MEEVVADASIPVDRDADEAEQRALEFLSNLRPEDFVQEGDFTGEGIILELWIWINLKSKIANPKLQMHYRRFGKHLICQYFPWELCAT